MNSKYMVMAMACAMSMSYATKIGVLKADKNFKCNKEITLDLDVEDSSNKTGVKDGTDPNPPGISLGGHAKFTYCVIDAYDMPKVPYDYVVLRMDSRCPAGAYPFARYHDTEDSNNANSPKNSDATKPSVITDNATLEYCFVPKTKGSKNKYPKFDSNGHKYGVFANTTGTNIAHSKIYIDDEDRQTKVRSKTCTWGWYYIEAYGRHEYKCKYSYSMRNGNDWLWERGNWTFPEEYKSDLDKIMTGDENTTYHTIRWTANSTSGMLAKSVDALDASVSAMPVSATIRGLDRSNITVELQTAGNAKISVMNVNGAVVANIAQENLMPGVHQVKWNSGIVPNGVYIVKVVHNGMVNSKRVILK